MEMGRNSCASWQDIHPHLIDEGRQPPRCLPWGLGGCWQTGFVLGPTQGDLEGIWWETSSVKSHQGRRGLGFTVLNIPGSQYTAAQGKHLMHQAFIAA